MKFAMNNGDYGDLLSLDIHETLDHIEEITGDNILTINAEFLF